MEFDVELSGPDADLRIARAGTQVTMVLELTGLDRILQSHDTVEECLQ